MFHQRGIHVRIVLLAFVFLFSGHFLVNGQTTSLSGTVTEAGTGMSLPGVSVFVKGTTVGTVTSSDGSYSLQVPSNAKTLVFSFVGLKTLEVAYTGQSTINMQMEEETVGLDEVVAVGYGVQKKVNLTGSITVVEGEALADRPSKDAVDMLQGVAPGLNISRSSGNIGETASINIRGVTTLGEGSNGSPLVLIDGLEGDLSLVNPQDIANISVLKDAASSSIYGSRAPFGVILVTTKKGEKGKVTVNYNNSFRVGGPSHWPNVSDSEVFARVINDNFINDGASPYFSDEWLDRIIRYKNGENIPMQANEQGRWLNGYNAGHANSNWMRAVFSDQSFSQEHNISFNGGSDKMQYYLSGGFLDQNGLLKINTDNYKRYNITGKINAELTSYLNVEFISRFVRKDYQRPTFLNSGIWNNILRQGWPIMPIYDDNGYLYDNAASPVLKLKDGGEHSEVKDVNTYQLKFTLTPLKGWNIVGNTNYETTTTFRQWYQVPFYNHDVNGNPYPASGGTESNVSEYAFKSDYYNLNIYTDYELTIKDHKVKLMTGSQVENFYQRELSGQRTGLISPEIHSLSTTTGIDSRGSEITPSLDGTYYDWSVAGFFGRFNYNYGDRYLFEANLRYDGSSRFRRGSRWQLLPSFSFGWNIVNEQFWNIDEVDQFKLRISYGSLGNQNTNVWYPTYVTQPVGNLSGTWLVGGNRPNTSSAPGLISSGLTWEKVETYNLGIDYALLDTRVSGSFDYFIRNTLDMVGPAPELPNTLGTAVPRQNNTDLKTYGWELALNWNDALDFGADRLRYGLSVVLSDSQTEITRYPNETMSLSTYREGQKLGEIWGYETIGIAKTQEEMDAHLAPLTEGGQFGYTNLTAGDIMYKDLDNDKKISSGANTLDDPGDRRIIGNNTPRFRLGTTFTANYNGFDFRAFFQGVLKRDYFTESQMFFPAGWIWGTIVLDEQLDYFRADPEHPLGQNLDSYYGRPLSNGRNRLAQSKYVLDASYVRLKNLTIGYTLPHKLTNTLGISNLRIYTSGENLFTLTKLTKIFDPELIRTDSQNSYPIFKTYSVGLSITL